MTIGRSFWPRFTGIPEAAPTLALRCQEQNVCIRKEAGHGTRCCPVGATLVCPSGARINGGHKEEPAPCAPHGPPYAHFAGKP